MKKRSKSKEAKFFCESCGSEVPRNSKTCPTCGKFFASVRCPQCGRIGTNEDFKNGCPTCGYAVNPDTELGHGNYGIAGMNGRNNKGKNRYGARGLLGLSGSRSGSSGTGGYVESSLPWWVYLVCLLILAVLVAGLYSCL